jgi:hypothetical protein
MPPGDDDSGEGRWAMPLPDKMPPTDRSAAIDESQTAAMNIATGDPRSSAASQTRASVRRRGEHRLSARYAASLTSTSGS